MFSLASRRLVNAATNNSRFFSSTAVMGKKVAVLGAAGGIGQPLSLLLKLSPNVSELSCYDIVGTPGVAADLSHIPTASSVTGNLPAAGSWPPSHNTGIEAALTGASVVVIPAGVPRKPGMTRDDLFNTNAGIVKGLVEACADFCPDAVLAIISNPVNSTVPIAAEVLKKKGVYNPKKLCGVTTLDVCRANTFVAASMGKDPKDVNVTVIGGHAGITILPLFSQVPGFSPSDEDREALTVRTQFGGDEVVKAKAGAGSATLSMAYAGYLFTEEVLRAMNGADDVVQCAFVESSLTDAPFFSSPCKFGPDGVTEVMGFGEISAYEQKWMDQMLPDLKKQIQKGIDFANQ
ncbi:malate dehydrogenase [Nitzschia inconspicua]|uniref:Malate dehydrogenase n=1 Tax=Nitzschia inconspicua TaxID=303405 RepID=A0A9K3PMR5_9STRA|nr:malate dehydrogenase [Nitzschia inconspicua]